jgi:hypothetical protein
VKRLIFLLSVLLLGCQKEEIERFDGKLFCSEGQAFIITWSVGGVYKFIKTPAADKLCLEPPNAK